MKQYEGATRCIPVMPLEEDEGLALPKIYGSVLVDEDLAAMRKTRRPDRGRGRKRLDNVRDIFYVNDKLSKRIILKGEAGYGKTVFCLKIVESWTNVKIKSRHEGESKRGGSEETKHMLGQTKGAHICESNSKHEQREGISRDHSPFIEQETGIHFLNTVQATHEEKLLQECLSEFDIVFYVPLRHAKPGTSSIVDLVCGSVPDCGHEMRQKIKQMLDDRDIPCLVVLDGLDEWRAPPTCRIRGFPDSDASANCVVLCSMRPWRMVNLQLQLDGACDKVVQIIGLKRKTVNGIIKNVLVHFYGMKTRTPLFKRIHSEYCRKAKRPTLRSLMKIPLMLTSCCHVWFEEDGLFGKIELDNDEGEGDDNVISNDEYDDSESSDYSNEDEGDDDDEDDDKDDDDNVDDNIHQHSRHKNQPYFMTQLYIKLTELTIARATNKHDEVRTHICNNQQNRTGTDNMPNILSNFSHIVDFLDVIKLVGKLALRDLLSDETNLIFPKDELERNIGKSNVDLALKAGILSQSKVPGLSYQQRISVSFYHKSIQEFVAALTLSLRETEDITLFCTYCNTVYRVMELSNMIMFVCGLDPAVGSQLSEHVKQVMNADAYIINFRDESNAVKLRGFCNIFNDLNKIHRKWFREINHNMAFTHQNDYVVTLYMPHAKLHVTDVFLDDKTPLDIVRMFNELTGYEDNSIVLVFLSYVHNSVHCIIQNLAVCKHLTRLHIEQASDTQILEALACVLPQLVHLHRVVYSNMYVRFPDYTNIASILRAVQTITSLKSI